MAIYFSGTDTGQFYKAGSIVSNGNGTYRANDDGSFTNLRTGRTAEGSSKSDTAVFINTNTSGGSESRSGGGSGPGRPSAGGSGPAAGGGAGKPGVITGKPETSGPGVPAVVGRSSGSGSVLGGGFLSALGVTFKPENAIQKAKIVVMGFDLPLDPGTSDVDKGWEPRYGEPGEWVGGIVNMAVDGYKASGFKAPKAASDLAAAARDFGGYVADRRKALNEPSWTQPYRPNPDPQPWAPLGHVGGHYTGGGF